MENVFGGVSISTEDEIRPHGSDPDIRLRPWLAGLTVSSVDVRLLAEDEPKKER
jgi:hypothetical protein